MTLREARLVKIKAAAKTLQVEIAALLKSEHRQAADLGLFSAAGELVGRVEYLQGKCKQDAVAEVIDEFAAAHGIG